MLPRTVDYGTPTEKLARSDIEGAEGSVGAYLFLSSLESVPPTPRCVRCPKTPPTHSVEDSGGPRRDDLWQKSNSPRSGFLVSGTIRVDGTESSAIVTESMRLKVQSTTASRALPEVDDVQRLQVARLAYPAASPAHNEQVTYFPRTEVSRTLCPVPVARSNR